MNKNLSLLFSIAGKTTRNIIGLMSGTSLDGLDIALCAIQGSGMHTKVKVEHFKTVAYPDSVKDEIRKIFAKENISFQQLCLLNPWIANIHAEYILQSLHEWKISPTDIDLIASHGQTVYHSPKILHKKEGFPNATLQIGDGDHISVKTGIITVSDFRQKHLAAGGEGAPLALYGDYCFFSKQGENRIMLNMGGIANFTFLPASLHTAEVFVTDTGPGNTLIDALAQKYFDKPFDDNAQLAAQGKVNELLLQQLKNNDFFRTGFPKTTGPELFNLSYIEAAQTLSGTGNIDNYDLLATITRFSADTITDALLSIIKQEKAYNIYVSGGGAHNPLLMQWISQVLPEINISSTEVLGISGDAKEAVLFAMLANETVAGTAIDFGNRKGLPAVTMGKISFPV
jgi:anhydro-N-acetylmuramic acid kinase